MELLSLPELPPGAVLVEIAYSGICRSQLLEVQGHRGDDPYIPHALGHEAAGTVRAIGNGVSKVSVGDRVVVTWIRGEGADVRSFSYAGANDTVNSGAVSTFMTSSMVSENRLVPIDDSVSMREAVLLGCAIPTGVGAVLNAADARPGSSTVVFGVGGVGLCAIGGAKVAESDPIIAVDVVPEKLELARQMGATHTVDASSVDAVEAIRELTNGAGADNVIEAAGRVETMEAALAATRIGGVCVLAGNLPHGQRISLDPFDLIKGKRLIGTAGGGTVPDRDIPRYAEFIASGKLTVQPILDEPYPLSRVNDALEALDAGRAGRATIDMRLE